MVTRSNPALNTQEVISQLCTGEALVSFLDEHGAPAMVERALILPPEGGIGPISREERRDIIDRSLMQRLYGTVLDRKSAHEILTGRQKEETQDSEDDAYPSPWEDMLGSVVKQAGRTIGSTVGRELGRAVIRGLLGGIFGKRR